jgi:hypothetical protein
MDQLALASSDRIHRVGQASTAVVLLEALKSHNLEEMIEDSYLDKQLVNTT